jgi:hypothetical protein
VVTKATFSVFGLLIKVRNAVSIFDEISHATTRSAKGANFKTV